MASYKIVIEARALKELHKLNKPIRQRIAEAIDVLRHDPRPSNSRKMVDSGGFRLRVGHRKDIYRSR